MGNESQTMPFRHCMSMHYGSTGKWLYLIALQLGFFLTLSQTTTISTPPKLKELADDKFKFDENGTQFSKW